MNEPNAHPSSALSPSTIHDDDAPWEQFQRPYVRDLAFALACPNVITHWIDFAVSEYANEDSIKNDDTNSNKSIVEVSVHTAEFWKAQYQAYQRRLEILDKTEAYQSLTRYLLARPSPSRLGFHFEGLISFWLTDGFAHGLHPYEMLASNVQLFCGKQTSGELDLILYNHSEQLTEHWELAIKFFMGSAPFAPINWVGINSKDNLQRKMTHMQTKQFRAQCVDTKNHGQVNIDKRYAVIKGRFFLPMVSTDFIYPDWFTPSFPLHRWLSLSRNQNSRIDNNISKLPQSQAQTSHVHENIEPFPKAIALRQAHYIEWFTQRNFYNKKSDEMSPTITPFRQGLYFVQLPSQQHYEPIVMLYTDVAEQDKTKV